MLIQNLIMTTDATHIDLSNAKEITGISIDEFSPIGTQANYLLKASDAGAKWELYVPGSHEWKTASTQALTANSVLQEGMTRSDIAEIPASALQKFCGKKLALAAAIASEKKSVFPKIKNFTISYIEKIPLTSETTKYFSINMYAQFCGSQNHAFFSDGKLTMNDPIAGAAISKPGGGRGVWIRINNDGEEIP